MKNVKLHKLLRQLCILAGILTAVGADGATPYTIVDTGQNSCYDNKKSIDCPSSGSPFDGQDAQYQGNPPRYRDNGNGIVIDLNTGLMWQKTPSRQRVSFARAKAYAKEFRLGGYDDWRLPTIKELYSLIDFRGQTGMRESESIPYINTDYFDFYFGFTDRGRRLIDAQYWSATQYTGTTMNGTPTVFGVNFADGRIKGYPCITHGPNKGRFVRYVRGNPDYGKNDFIDNGDGTVTDRATGLIWMKTDSGKAMNWQQALAFAQNASVAGYTDWRLPNAKELQSIVDYSKSPRAALPQNRGRSIDPVFAMSDPDGWYWTGTTHLEHGRASRAVYLCFGQAWGYMAFGGTSKRRMDVHGSGSQRSDPKSGDPKRYPQGFGPQGDEIRIYNRVRLVRGGTVKKTAPVRTGTGSYDIRAQKAAKITRSSVHMGDEPGRQAKGPSSRDVKDSRPMGINTGFVKRLDRDNDNQVSRKEFDGPLSHFDRLDRNGDGFLSKDEAPRRPPFPRE